MWNRDKKTGRILPNTIQDILLDLIICEPSALETGCWIWPGKPTHYGYGQTHLDGRNRKVHRVIYEHFVGPISERLQIDHLCRNRMCCNFEHLEAVTCKENLRRGLTSATAAARQKVKTHCPLGHPYEGDNLYLLPQGKGRACRTCARIRGQAFRDRRREIRDGNRPG